MLILQVDLVGGYYDASDNVKFGLPLAFTVTMLSWSVLEYGSQLESQGQLEYSLEAIKWGTDYIIKAHPEPNLLMPIRFSQVGDRDYDQLCWQRPVDMTTIRQAYAISPQRPSSDLAGEAMAAALLAFRSVNLFYADELLLHSRQLFTLADTHRGKYVSNIPLAKKYYQSTSGYDDELLWAAIWLHEASGEEGYLKYVVDNGDQLGGNGWGMDQFSWDNKYAGVQLKVTKLLLDGRAGDHTLAFQRYQAKAESYLCAAIHKNHGTQMPKTPGGMYWIYCWNNMQYVTTAAFLLTVGHDYYSSVGQQLSHCTSAVDNAELLAAGKTQVDYILGLNNSGLSFLVGYGDNYPQRVHHRPASMVAFKKNSRFIGCKDGYANWYKIRTPNPNLLVGAVVGGPDQIDDFVDERDAYLMTEPATYNTAPLVGVFARLQVGGSSQHDAGLHQSAAASEHQGTHQSQVLHGRTQAPKTTFPPVRVVQKLQEEWSFGAYQYYKYARSVENVSKHNIVSSLSVVIHRLYGPLWGLTPKHTNGNFYTFPATTKALAPGQKIDFTYIHHSEEAQIFDGKYTLV